MTSLGIGLSDLFGRRVVSASSAVTAGAGMQLFAMLISIAAVAVVPSTFATSDLVLGGLSGFGLAVGLSGYYQGLTLSSSTVVAPLVATMSAVIPFVFAIIRGAEASGRAIVGAALAFVGLAVISSSGRSATNVAAGLRWGSISGLGYGFGLSIVVDVADESGAWPAVSQRLVACGFLALVALRFGHALRPPDGQTRNLAIAGAFAGLATVTYLLGIEADAPTAIITASLFPAASVAIGYLSYRDPVSRLQLVGLAVVLLGVIGVVLG